MSSAPVKSEKCEGAILDSAIGDALGWPNEYRARNASKNLEVNEHFVGWTRRCGRPKWYNEKIMPGEYSDDTQMIIAVARSIIAGNWENTFINKELPFWLNYERGGGKAMLKAAEACKRGILLWQSRSARGYFNAGGNGAAMRILPHVIAGTNLLDLRELMNDVIKDSIITHGHPRAILGATCYAYALDYLLKKESTLEYGELVTAILDGQHIWGAYPDSLIFKEWIETAKNASDYDYAHTWALTLGNMEKQFYFINKSLKKGLMLDDKNVLTQLECFGKVGGAGDVAILASVYLLSRYANNPVLGIKTPAFSFGADTDTIASITGGLLGMLCGISWIPNKWKVVQDYGCLMRIPELLLSCNIRETTKTVLSTTKEQYRDWQNTPIGKMRLLNTSTIPIGKAEAVIISKWESVFGQTLYRKEYTKKDNESCPDKIQMQIQFETPNNMIQQNHVNEMAVLNDAGRKFTIAANDIVALAEKPQLQKITFRKVLQIAETLLTDNQESVFIAKRLKVDSTVVDLIKTYIE
jgi:ADP-ribosylglycohydrolase